MLKEFIDFVDSVLPELSQGDIISQVPFTYFEEDGRQMKFTADAMVISTSCHIDQKDKILMVPVLPIDSFTGNLVELKKNMIFDFMYISDWLLFFYYKIVCIFDEKGRS